MHASPWPIAEERWDPHADTRPITNSNVRYRQVPLDSPDAVLVEHVTEAALGLQMHQHTNTCKKGGRDGGHLDCRMGYDRPLVNATHAIGDNQAVLLRRTHGNLVGFIPGLMMAEQCNHHMSVCVEASRHARDHLLWRDRVAEGTTKVGLVQGAVLICCYVNLKVGA